MAMAVEGGGGWAEADGGRAEAEAEGGEVAAGDAWVRGEPLTGRRYGYGLPAGKLCRDGTPNLQKATSAADVDAGLAAAGVRAPAGATLAARRQELARVVRVDRAQLKSVGTTPPRPPPPPSPAAAAAAHDDAALGVPEWVAAAAPQVVLQRGSSAVGESMPEPKSFGSAAEAGSFNKLASFLNSHPRVAEGVGEQPLLDMGVAACLCCARFHPVISAHAGLCMHLRRSPDEAHREFLQLMDGTPGAYAQSLQHRAAPESAAAYYCAVMGPLERATRGGGRSQATVEEVETGHQRWAAAAARREVRDAFLRDIYGRAPPRSAAAPPPAAVPGGVGLPDPGGATAHLWGTLPRKAFRGGKVMALLESGGYDGELWSWLDDVPAASVKEMDTVVSRTPLYEHRSEYNAVVHAALKCANEATGAAQARGWKALVLIKAVTTGRLRTGPRRGVKEVLGRIRQVACGHLQLLTEELFCEAVYLHEIAERAAAGAAAAGELREGAFAPGAEEASRAEAVQAMADEGLTPSARLPEGDDLYAIAEVDEAEGAEAELMEEAAAGEQPAVVGSSYSAGGPAAAAEASQGAAPAASEEAQQLGDTFDEAKTLARVLQLCAAGYLSKGYGQFKVAAMADPTLVRVAACLRALHPQTVPAPLPDDPLVRPEQGKTYELSDDAFWEVFHAPPKERGLSFDAISYEEIAALYHGGQQYRGTLRGLVQRINGGDLHPACLEIVGDSLLYGLEKPDKSTRPIGVGAAFRRMAGRCIYAQYKLDFARVLTTSKPSAEMLARFGFAADRACNAPLQVGCGLAGGAEVAVNMVRVALEMHEGWAVLSDDKRNGYNTLSRESIFKGVRRWFPELLPTVRMFYAREGGLYVREMLRTAGTGEYRDEARLPSRGAGPRPTVDGAGMCYYSREGCTQGDPLGPILWSLAYHQALLEIQAQCPDTLIVAYLDDTYYLQTPAEALRSMRVGDVVTTAVCGVTSNEAKQEVFSMGGDLAGMPSSIRGAPSAPPDAAADYAGGRLLSIKVLGAFVGDAADCSRRLVARQEKALKPLRRAVRLRDTREIHVAMQVQMMIVRYCANTQLNYFLRAMPLEATAEAAARHDELVWEAEAAVVGMQQATAGERRRAREQAGLPVRMGGLGLTPQTRIRPAARIGMWALVWRPMQQLCPRIFGDVEIDEADTASFRELRAAHKEEMEKWKRVHAVHTLWKSKFFDIDKDGEGHYRFVPGGLPPRFKLLPVAEFATESDHLQHAQRTWSQIAHHSAWLKLLSQQRQVAPREAVRMISVAQPHAGAWLNAVPSRKAFRINSWAMRIAVQRRLGLPLTAHAASGSEGRGRHGRPFDVMGDLAQNDGEEGHQTRHWLVLTTLVAVLREAFGARVQYEPGDFRDYSDTRPDLAIEGMGAGGGMYLGDTKVKDPVGSDPATTALRGGFVALGNTQQEANAVVHGRRERGQPGTRFDPRTGAGHVAAVEGQYERAEALGLEVQALLFEVWGGFSAAVVELLRKAAETRGNKLRKSEYDEASWSTRTWTTFAAQRIACALTRAVATEVAHALSLPTARDPRVRGVGG